MKLSVIIPAFNREELLIRCLRSLDVPVQRESDYEVCVVDDGSGLDEEKIRSQIAVHYPLIWRSFENQRGRSAARNEGIRSTSGDIIVFHDSDMEAQEGCLHAHLNRHYNQSGTAVIGKILWPKGGSFLRYIGSRGAAKIKPDDAVPPRYFVTGNASLERCNLPEKGPFDETLPGWGGEDLDLGIKLHAAGVTFVYAPEAVSYHNFRGNLTNHIRRTSLYGAQTLPVLISRHPELKTILKINLMDSFFWRLVVSDPVFLTVLWKARILDKLFLPDMVYDYLTFAAYARGWLKREKK